LTLLGMVQKKTICFLFQNGNLAIYSPKYFGFF
jgi:hypothetical protein